MTIKRTSRYYDGPLAQLKNEKKKVYEIAVYRKFPESINTFQIACDKVVTDLKNPLNLVFPHFSS